MPQATTQEKTRAGRRSGVRTGPDWLGDALPADAIGGTPVQMKGGDAWSGKTAHTKGDAAPMAPVQMKKPQGWVDNDQTTWLPEFYGGYSYDLVIDAFSTLDLDANRDVANKWASKALTSGLVGKGPVRSTYKSSYDQDPDAFSVSQDVPLLDPLVVHAHISSADVVALDGGVNLKWKHDEIGNKAANVPSDIGSGLIDVKVARDHWENNPNHDKAEEDAMDLATGKAIALMFDLDAIARQEASDKAARELAQKKAETDLINWGWKNTKDKKRYGTILTGAQTRMKNGDATRYQQLLQLIRDAQARAAQANVVV